MTVGPLQRAPEERSPRGRRLLWWARKWARRCGLAAGALALAGLAALAVLDRIYPFPLARLDAAYSARVALADGSQVGRRVAVDGQWRRPAELAELGTWLPLATIAIEDRRFRSHPGVDPVGVLRAAFANVRARRVVQGGSTLTMQLIGMAFETPRTLRGKLIEAFRAVQLERLWSKDEILARYLEFAPYGRNFAGAVAGAEHWFGKAPRDLSLAEAALLAGLPQGPTRLRPDLHPERALLRRQSVLDMLLQRGDIDREQHRRSSAMPVGLSPRVGLVPRGGPGAGATQDATVAPPAWDAAWSSPASVAVDASHAVAFALRQRPEGGVTTLVPPTQRTAERLVQAHAARLPSGTDLAVVVIDVAAADIVAWVGSADPSDPIDGQNDGVRARRSPGSTLKPFVYAAAFERGLLSPSSLVLDAPIDLGGWAPKNFDGGFHGEVSVGEALQRSLNLPALRVARSVGVERCVGLIEAAGVRLDPDAVSHSGLTLVTGGSPVSLLELTDAYATLARGGLHVAPRLYADAPRGAPVRALSEGTCTALFKLLSSETRAPRVTGGASHVGARPFCWKTGTSAGHVDAWAVGHDGVRAAGVWVGRFDGGSHPAYVGGEAAEPLLAELFVALAGA